ncbi:efflux RND transporter permease subunit [Desulfatitalea alkaliphila]|uniref:Efflux RND transporter permease subunit n=1 Tax=Desulfatitalea alkaliphila TaxID=2929485 RepID=A0AA41R0N5_9BACT|nr:efflux RND transporter permease subunit [Desulfatitalea alkaliphila]MCJ8499773.1 efflux RND transporter permease subunit [Desulfatitalea alkaliphila]
MFLADAAIRRPVAMGCLIIALTLLGLNASRKMGVEFMPRMDAPFITIVTIYPGSSPEEIETDIARRIEDAVVSLDGLKHVNTVSMENVCQTLLEFEMGVDVDIAAIDVREQIDLVRSLFPQDVEDPIIQKFNVNAMPVITLALTGDAPLDALFDFADNDLKDRLTTIVGVAAVELVGGAPRQVQVLLDRDALQSRGLMALDVHEAIRGGVRTIPSGRVQERGTEYNVKFDADFTAIREILDLEIANKEGMRCRIGDVARVAMTTPELREAAAVDGRPAVSIRVVKKSDANTVEVTRRVRQVVDGLQGQLPGGMELVWVTDEGRFIEASVQSAWYNVAAGVLLTGGILFVFLYNLRALLVVSITMPLTIVIGLFFMQMAGFTLNTATLIAIGMSVGVLVANSIVVLEGIFQRLAEGQPPKAAAALGAKERFIAVLASAGTNTVVLFPLAVLDGMISMFITPLALTMIIMTLVSLFISFTLTPMLCSLLLKQRTEMRIGLLSRLSSGWNRGLAAAVERYRRLLTGLDRHRGRALVVVLGIVVLLVHALSLAPRIGFDLFQGIDRGEVIVKLEYPTRYDLDQTWRRVRQVEDRLSDLPGLRHRMVTVGKVEGILGQSSEGVYLAQLLLKFPERDMRTVTVDELIARIRARLTDYPEAIITVAKPATVGGGLEVPVEMEIAGPSLETLDRMVLRTRDLAAAIDGLKDIDTTAREGKPEIRIRPNRPVLSDRAMPAAALGTALRANLEGLTAGTYKQDARNYDIVVRMEPRQGKDQVHHFQFPGAPGQPVLLETLAELSEERAPVKIIRKNKQRVAKLTAGLERQLPLGSAVDRISTAIRDRGDFPPGYTHTFVGDYEVLAESRADLGEAAIIAIILVILTLAAILESFKQPVLILVTLPLALIGAMWALAFAGLSMDIFVLLGFVMMAGIVVNNAILIMDQFNVRVAEGRDRRDAMITAACERFRPILMTTAAAVLGMLPLAVATGIGAEMRNGIGVASVGGILVSGLLTMILMPVLYGLCTRRKQS